MNFGKEDIETLAKLEERSKNFEAYILGSEARFKALEAENMECKEKATELTNKVDTLESILSSMLKTGGKIVVGLFSSIGFVCWAGYSLFGWLTVNSKSVDDFFSKFRGE